MFKGISSFWLLFVTLMMTSGCKVNQYLKPYIGSYNLSGTVYHNGVLIESSSMLCVTTGDTISIINGKYSFDVKWYGSEKGVFHARKKVNKRWLTFVYKNSEIKLRNKWVKYGLKKVDKGEPQYRELDLFFKWPQTQ